MQTNPDLGHWSYTEGLDTNAGEVCARHSQWSYGRSHGLFWHTGQTAIKKGQILKTEEKYVISHPNYQKHCIANLK